MLIYVNYQSILKLFILSDYIILLISLIILYRLGIRVPQGFIITSETCKDFFKGNKAMSEHLIDCLKSSIKSLENKTGKVFDYKKESSMNEIPLLLSVRSGAAIDMPRF